MMKRVLLIASLAGCSFAQAGVLYNNGGPNLANAFEMSNLTQADDLKIHAPGMFNTLRFWTLEDKNPILDLTITIAYDNGDHTPTALYSFSAAVTRTATGRSAHTFDEAAYVAKFDDQWLSNDKHYYLGLHANDISNPGHEFQYIYWQTADDNGTQIHLFNQDGYSGWTTPDNDGPRSRQLAFSLEASPAPEPATMLALAMGGAALIRRKKQ